MCTNNTDNIFSAKELKEFERKQQEEKEAFLKEYKKKYGISEIELLAENLHKVFCGYNHTDGCGWFYESWEKQGYARKQWYDKALRFRNYIKDVKDNEEIKEISDKKVSELSPLEIVYLFSFIKESFSKI